MNVLFVAGKFDDFEGNPSGYAKKLNKELLLHFNEITFINGGNWTHLENICNKLGSIRYDYILWIPDISNDKPKLVDSIKLLSPFSMLVTSKNNINEKYSFPLLVAKALKTKSNLLLEFKKQEDKFIVNLIDPLGNCFLKEESDIKVIAKVLVRRLKELSSFTRFKSIQIGPKLDIPNKSDFFDIAKGYAVKFHELIHANNDRFLGNLSFRCEHGFSSFKENNLIFVSRRNIDKRDIDSNGFVACKCPLNGIIPYYGEKKPSVDTPIQMRLYDFYDNIKYMIHSHTYLKDAPMTRNIISCGAIEEFTEIADITNDTTINTFRINLKGHGSLVAGSSIDYFKDLPYIARPSPEYQINLKEI